MYTHYFGLYFGVFMWYNILGRGVMLSWRVDGVVFRVVPHNFVNLILHSTDVCCMRLVFTCVL